MTTPEDKMALAVALTDTTRSLDRTRKRVESLIEALEAVGGESVVANVTRCREGVVAIQQLNNAIRNMVA